jgi:AcrR family transcriptional regulator
MPRDTWYRLPEARRDAVLHAAEVEFAAHGFSRGSLNVIAREAGVAKGSLFQYFEDKVDLYTHLCVLAAERVAHELDGADHDFSAGFFAAYEEFLVSWVEHFRTHPIDRELSAAVALEPDPAARHAVRSVIEERELAFLRPLCEKAQADGFLRADADLDAFLALQLLVLPQLALAPVHADLDPLLGLGTDAHAAVHRLVVVFRDAFGA